MCCPEGPSESDAGATLKINLTALGLIGRDSNSTDAECAAVLECNAYGCRGVDPVADALAKSAAKRSLSPILLKPAFVLRRRIPSSTFFTGFTPAPRTALQSFMRNPSLTAQSSWRSGTLFITSNGWSGGCALNIDSGENRLGLSMTEAVQLSGRASFLNHGITLLMSSMASTETADDPQSERQISLFSELRRLYRGIPASLVGASAILCNRRSHFDLVRADWALFGINPILVRRILCFLSSSCAPASCMFATWCRGKASSTQNRSGVASRWSRSATPTAFRGRGFPRQAVCNRWRVSLSRNRAFVIGPARHRRHRLARRQSCMER